jgi:multidrug resistance efflux pump
MNLADYPLAIAKLERRILKTSKCIRRCQTHLEQLSVMIEQAIATDLDLKNEQQRKAKRLELLSTSDYQSAQRVLQTYGDRRAALEINLTLLKNRFSVAKLEQRAAIAQMEAIAA